MRLKLWAALAVGTTCAFAEDYPGEKGEIYGATGANNGTTPTTQEGDITIHYVTVGKKNNVFQPNSIVAKVGDIVSFQFYPLNHSVIHAAYGYPCIPIEDVDGGADPFYSGFFPVNSDLDNPPTWNLTVNHTDPIFYYCGRPGSCTDWGMVGVINAIATTPLATQIELAREADYELLPGESFPTENVEASLSRLAHSATAGAGLTATTAPGSDSTSGNRGSNHLSTGAVAGVAVGAAVLALVLAALFILMCRTRSLKRKLELKAAGSKDGDSWIEPSSPSTYTSTGNHTIPTRQASQLPPYRPYYQVERPDMNRPVRVQSMPIDSAGNAPVSPVSPQSPQESGVQYSAIMSPNQAEWDMNEIPEGQLSSPAAELDSRRMEISKPYL